MGYKEADFVMNESSENALWIAMTRSDIFDLPDRNI